MTDRTRRAGVRLQRSRGSAIASVRRNARDWLAITGAAAIAVGLSFTPLAWIAWIWVGGFLLFVAGAGRRHAG